ncbi:MAG: hypothetical protein ACK53V_21090, partial [Planctomycetota bacterium]
LLGLLSHERVTPEEGGDSADRKFQNRACLEDCLSRRLQRVRVQTQSPQVDVLQTTRRIKIRLGSSATSSA